MASVKRKFKITPRNYVRPTFSREGDNYTGSGIIPEGIFNEKFGIWVIVEKSNGGDIYTDIGGKYCFEDIDLLGCATREWNEETYYSHEITTKALRRAINGTVEIKDHKNKPTYLSYIVTEEVLLSDNTIQPLEFHKSRENAMKNRNKFNSDHLDKIYRTKDIVHIPYSDIPKILTGTTDIKFSSRLTCILEDEHFKPYLNENDGVEEIRTLTQETTIATPNK